MTNRAERRKHTTTTLITKDYDFTEEPPPFLVEGIIHSSITLIYGQTCSGKSTLAASLTAALANGQTHFLGHEIANDGKPMAVGIVAGDPLGASEYAELLVKSGAIGDGAVHVIEPHRPTRRETWAEVRDAAGEHGWDLVIVDNLSSFVPGSLNDDDSIKGLYEEIDPLPRAGTPVLIVAHTSEKWTDRGPSRIPMGSSFIRFGPRWWCWAHRSGGYLHLEFDGNRGTPHNIIVTEPDGTPNFEVVSTTGSDELATKRRNRQKKTLDERAEIGRFLAQECQGMTGAEQARRVVARFPDHGVTESTVKVYISKGRYPAPAAQADQG